MEIQDLQLKILQDFFLIQMTKSCGEMWKEKVCELVTDKFNSYDLYRNNYLRIKSVLDE